MRKETKWKIFSTVNDGSGGRRSRMYMGNSRSSRTQYGTLIFFVNGQARLTWYGVKDPESLKRLVKSLMRR